MKTFFIILITFMVSSLAGGVGMHYYDAWKFEYHVEFPLQDIYDADAGCEEESGETCSLSGFFAPDSYFKKIPQRPNMI